MALSVTTFLIGLGLGQLIAGPVSDGRGRRPTLLAGPRGLHRLGARLPRRTVRGGADRRALRAGRGGRVRPRDPQRDGHRLRPRARGGPALLLDRDHRGRGAAGGFADRRPDAPPAGLARAVRRADRDQRHRLRVRRPLVAREPAAGETPDRRPPLGAPHDGGADPRRPLPGLHVHRRLRLHGLLRLSGRLVVRPPAPVRRLADDVQHPVRRQRPGDAGGGPGQPPSPGPLLSAEPARRRPHRLRGRRRRGPRLGADRRARPLGPGGAVLRDRRQHGGHPARPHGAGPVPPSRGGRDRGGLLRRAAARARRAGDAADRHRRHGHARRPWRS